MKDSPRRDFVFQVRPGRFFLLAGLVAPLAGAFTYFCTEDRVHKMVGAFCIILGPLVALKGLFLWKKCFNCYRGGLGWGGHFVAYEDIEMVRATIRSGPHKIVRDCKFLFQGSNSD